MQEYSAGDLLIELEWKRCAPDWDAPVDVKLKAFIYWCSNHVYIRHPELGRIKFDLRPSQIETAETWLRHRYTIALKARQVGFSTLVSVFCLWIAFFYEDRNIIMLSKGEREAAMLLDHAKYAFGFLPDWMLSIGPMCKPNATMMRFSNGSAMSSLPSAADPARGATAFIIVVDEMGQLPNSDQAWASIEPVADVGGQIIMLGTANGEGNLFHKLWVGAVTGMNRFSKGAIFHSWRAGGRTQEWYDAKKADPSMPEWQLHQEYPDNADEAFLKSGRPVFDAEKLRNLEFTDPRRGYLQLLQEPADGQSAELIFLEDGGDLRIWDEPKVGHTYAIGADVAEGLDWGDYSVAYVHDVINHKIVAKWHGHIDADLFGSEILANLGWWYNNALIGVESNNHGLTTLTALKRTKYPNIFRQRRLTVKSPIATEQMGWRTDVKSKFLAMDELAKAIREGTLILPCSETAAELRMFVRDGNGKMHGTPHDDRVMALGICLQMLNYVWLDRYQHKPEPGPGTFGHLMKTLYKEEKKNSSPFGRFGTRKIA